MFKQHGIDWTEKGFERFSKYGSWFVRLGILEPSEYYVLDCFENTEDDKEIIFRKQYDVSVIIDSLIAKKFLCKTIMESTINQISDNINTEQETMKLYDDDHMWKLK